MYKKKKPQTERCDIQKLLTDRDSKEEYAKKIKSEVHKLDTDKPADIILGFKYLTVNLETSIQSHEMVIFCIIRSFGL